MTRHRRSKLDMTSVGFIIAAFTLFLIAALSYAASVFIYYVTPEITPRFSLLEIGNMAGIGGMLVVPLFVITAVAVNIRERHRDKKAKVRDDNSEPGAAGRS